MKEMKSQLKWLATATCAAAVGSLWATPALDIEFTRVGTSSADEMYWTVARNGGESSAPTLFIASLTATPETPSQKASRLSAKSSESADFFYASYTASGKISNVSSGYPMVNNQFISNNNTTDHYWRIWLPVTLEASDSFNRVLPEIYATTASGGAQNRTARFFSYTVKVYTGEVYENTAAETKSAALLATATGLTHNSEDLNTEMSAFDRTLSGLSGTYTLSIEVHKNDCGGGAYSGIKSVQLYQVSSVERTVSGETNDWSTESAWSDGAVPGTLKTAVLKVADNATLTLDVDATPSTLQVLDGSTSGTPSLTFAGTGSLTTTATTLEVDTDVSAITASLGAVTLASGKTLTVAPSTSYSSLVSGTTSSGADDASKVVVDATTSALSVASTDSRSAVLKSFTGVVEFLGSGSTGATVEFGYANAAQAFKPRFIFNGGTHTMKYGCGDNLFSPGGTDKKPTISVEEDTTLTFVFKDLSGWSGTTAGTTGTPPPSVIRVGKNGRLTFDDNGINTGYFRDRLLLDSGAEVTNDHSGFYFYGGVAGVAQLAMLDNQGTATWNGGFKTDKSASKIEIGTNSTLCLNGVITGSQEITKAGAGTLTLTGVSTDTATLTISAGTVKLQDSGSWAGPIANSGTLEVANATDKTLTNTISGAGTVKKSGEGTLSLTGSVSTPVEVAAGTLDIGTSRPAVTVTGAGTTLKLTATQDEMNAGRISLASISAAVEGVAFIITVPTGEEVEGTLDGSDVTFTPAEAYSRTLSGGTANWNEVGAWSNVTATAPNTGALVQLTLTADTTVVLPAAADFSAPGVVTVEGAYKLTFQLPESGDTPVFTANIVAEDAGTTIAAPYSAIAPAKITGACQVVVLIAENVTINAFNSLTPASSGQFKVKTLADKTLTLSQTGEITPDTKFAGMGGEGNVSAALCLNFTNDFNGREIELFGNITFTSTDAGINAGHGGTQTRMRIRQTAGTVSGGRIRTAAYSEDKGHGCTYIIDGGTCATTMLKHFATDTGYFTIQVNAGGTLSGPLTKGDRTGNTHKIILNGGEFTSTTIQANATVQIESGDYTIGGTGDKALAVLPESTKVTLNGGSLTVATSQTLTGALTGSGALVVGDGATTSSLTLSSLGTVADGVATHAGSIEVKENGVLTLKNTVSTTLTGAVTGAGKLVIGDGASATQVTQAAVGCDISAIEITAGATYTVSTAGMAGSGNVMLPATTTVTVAEGSKLVVDTARWMNANVTGAGEVEVTNTATYVFAADQTNRLAPGKLTVTKALTLQAARDNDTELSVSELCVQAALTSTSSNGIDKPVVKIAEGQVLSGHGSIAAPLVFEAGAIFDTADSEEGYWLTLTEATITWPESGTVKVKSDKTAQLMQFAAEVGLSYFELENTGSLTGLYLHEEALFGGATMLYILKEMDSASLPEEIAGNAAVKDAIQAAIETWAASGFIITEIKAATAQNTSGVAQGSAQAVDCFTNLETTVTVAPDWEGGDFSKGIATVTYDFGVADMTIRDLQLGEDSEEKRYVLLAAQVRNSVESNTADFASGTTLSVLNGETPITSTEVSAAVAGAAETLGVKWLAVPFEVLFPAEAATGTRALKVKVSKVTTN